MKASTADKYSLSSEFIIAGAFKMENNASHEIMDRLEENKKDSESEIFFVDVKGAAALPNVKSEATNETGESGEEDEHVVNEGDEEYKSSLEQKSGDELPNRLRSSSKDSNSKVFIGQIPKSYSESDVKLLFASFCISQVHLLTDPVTKLSKGCAFVTLSSEEEAKRAVTVLHKSTTLNGMNHPIQVKLAGVNLHQKVKTVLVIFKVFVSGLDHQTTDIELKQVFERFGKVDDVFVMKDYDGTCKGFAFIKFEESEHAKRAISALDNTELFENSKVKVTVKFADNQKQRMTRRLLKSASASHQSSLSGHSAIPNNMPIFNPYLYPPFGLMMPPNYPMFNSSPLALNNAAQAGSGSQQSPTQNNYYQFLPPSQFGLQQPLGTTSIQQASPMPISQLDLVNKQPPLSNYQMQHQARHSMISLPHSYTEQNSFNGTSFLPNYSPSNYNQSTHQASSHFTPHAANPAYNPSAYSSQSPSYPSTYTTRPARPSSARTSQPSPTLYVTNLPHTFTSSDLFNLFSGFGLLKSANMHLDKATQTFKNFGYVQFDLAECGERAIKQLDNSLVCGKKIKVCWKRQSKPY